ncbi:MAG: hypothetical protein GY754_41400 [bacterium]|nr:hypothetical protein [bacterium]
MNSIGKQFSIGETAACDILYQHEFEKRLSLPVKTNYGWFVPLRDNPGVVLLDEKLNTISTLPLPGQSTAYESVYINSNNDSSLFSVSSETAVTLYNKSGNEQWKIEHDKWESYQGSSCLFDREARLWTVFPGEEPGLMVLNRSTGEVLASSPIDSEDGTFFLHLNSIDGSVLIEEACGQDGCFIYRAVLNEKTITLSDYGFDDRVLSLNNPVFSPHGKHFVTSAQYGENIQIHELESGSVLTEIEADPVFEKDSIPDCEEPDSFDFDTAYISDSRAIVRTRFGRLLLIDINRAAVAGTLWPNGIAMTGYDDHGKETSLDTGISGYDTGIISFYVGNKGEMLIHVDEKKLMLVDI